MTIEELAKKHMIKDLNRSIVVSKEQLFVEFGRELVEQCAQIAAAKAKYLKGEARRAGTTFEAHCFGAARQVSEELASEIRALAGERK